MAKKKIDNEIFKTLIEDYNIKDTNDIKEMVNMDLIMDLTMYLEIKKLEKFGYLIVNRLQNQEI